MKKLLAITFLISLIACDNAASVEKEAVTIKKKADTLIDKVNNSKFMDSVRSKGEMLLDSSKSKGGRVWDSTRSKGGKLLNKAGEKINKLKK